MTDRAGRSMARGRGGLVHALAAAVAALAVSGCVAGTLGGAPETAQTETGAAEPAAASAAASGSTGPALQPAPDLFAAEEWALWDGRRTLGGSWVALPDTQTARRVRLTNTETGAQTDGALIRRDPARTGPRLEISSEAAALLGLRPGVATPVEIVALVYQAAAVMAADLDPASQPPDQMAIRPQDGTPDSPAAPAPTVKSAARRPASERQPAAAGLAAATQAGLPPAPARTPDVAPASATTPAPEALSPTPPPKPVHPTAAPELPPEPSADVAASPGPATPETPVEQGPPAATSAIADGLPFIQAGIFRDEENAARLIARLRSAGLPAEGLPLARGAESFTRVVIGPYQDETERDRALETVRQIGPADAAPVRG